MAVTRKKGMEASIMLFAILARHGEARSSVVFVFAEIGRSQRKRALGKQDPRVVVDVDESRLIPSVRKVRLRPTREGRLFHRQFLIQISS